MGAITKRALWLRAKGCDVAAGTIRINPRYARLLKISPGESVEIVYKEGASFRAKVDLSEEAPRGEVHIKKDYLESLKIPEGDKLLILMPETETEK